LWGSQSWLHPAFSRIGERSSPAFGAAPRWM